MAFETSVFTFRISVPFEQWAAIFDSEDIRKMHDENGIQPLYRGVSEDDPMKVIVIHQAEAGVAKAFFEASREPIEAGGHIWDSTEITLWKAG
ncbi:MULTISPECIES: DUF3764 family protein [Prochlorococcus]|nr:MULTISPECIES: DUF3764 family protein [Prochlorococcus]KGG13413.1 hypothetical protein EV04_0648 [Prochlorococcus marinus str. LG]KGG24325.1 hypothetical protein EV09_0372 [Prochlorococcus marinus str. SS35]KGG33609.1 hypothetical protein EV10_0449 [Prochlorococcus marinus str. SS51]